MAVQKALFVCLHNSARSQMAEAFLKKYEKEMEVDSAGIEPGTINPYVVKVMQEEGIDLSKNETTKVFDLYKAGNVYKYVIAVCDEAAQKCPIFPGVTHRLNWSFSDPSQFKGTEEEILAQTREVKDQIKQKIIDFIEAELS